MELNRSSRTMKRFKIATEIRDVIKNEAAVTLPGDLS